MAILLVLFFHGLLYTHSGGRPLLEKLTALSGRLGALGVLIFFCISGYLITQRMLVEARRDGRLSLRNFYIKRVFRIIPPLAVYLVVISALGAVGVIHLVGRDAFAAVFLSNYWPGSVYTSHFWSLSVEEHYYLFWPVCIALVGWRRAMWVGVAVVTAVAVWRPWRLHQLPRGVQASALWHTEMRVDYIMLGAILSLVLYFYPDSVKLFRRLGSNLSLVVLLSLFAATTAASTIDLRTVQAIVLTLLVCCSAIADSSIPRALLASRPLLFIGKVSYSLYIWQEVVLAPSQYQFWNSPLALPLKYALCFALAYSSYRFVERPFIRYGRSLLKAPESSLRADSPQQTVV